LIQQSDYGGTAGSDQVRMRPGRRRVSPGRGAIAQVILFLSIWGTIVPLCAILAGWGSIAETLERSDALGPDGKLSPDVDLAQLNTLLMSATGATLIVAAATALGTALSVWIMQRFFQGPSLLDLGLRRRPGWLPDTVIGLVLGPVMFLAILVVLLATGWASTGPGTIEAGTLLSAFVIYVLVAFSEEVFARGWVLQVLERGRGKVWAAVGSAVVFSILHAANPGFSVTALLGLFLAGLLFAQAYFVTRQLWLPIALHLSWNFSEGPLFGFPVSGMAAEGLLTVVPTGPEVVTGGPFGPEAGLVVIVGIAIASGALYWLGRRRADRAPAAVSEERETVGV